MFLSSHRAPPFLCPARGLGAHVRFVYKPLTPLPPQPSRLPARRRQEVHRRGAAKALLDRPPMLHAPLLQLCCSRCRPAPEEAPAFTRSHIQRLLFVCMQISLLCPQRAARLGNPDTLPRDVSIRTSCPAHATPHHRNIAPQSHSCAIRPLKAEKQHSSPPQTVRPSDGPTPRGAPSPVSKNFWLRLRIKAQDKIVQCSC